MKDKIKEIVSALAILIVGFLILDPMSFYYTNMQTASLVIILLIAYVAFQIFIWKAKPQDEREDQLLYRANANAYLFGTAVLVIGLVYQAFSHSVDVWLLIALLVMIISRMASCFYKERD